MVERLKAVENEHLEQVKEAENQLQSAFKELATAMHDEFSDIEKSKRQHKEIDLLHGME